ncbi:MAG: hypothetical protein ACKVIS_24305 [Pseudomonadales bacterium]
MDNPLPTLLENNIGFAILSGLFVLFGFAMKILKGAFDFHYEYFTRRHLRRITDLLPLVDPGSLQHDFLKQAISIEVFKITSGLKTTTLNAAALMHLCKYKYISPNQVKLFERHTEIQPGGHVLLSIKAMDKFIAYYSGIAASVILIFGLSALITSFKITDKYGWIAGVVVMLMCIGAASFFLKDWRSYKTVKRIQSQLQANLLPICEECQTVPRSQGSQPRSAQMETPPELSPGQAGASVTPPAAQTPQPNAAHTAAVDPSSG